MAINRYSKGPLAADVQSEFIPLPIDVIDSQLERRQNQYDKTKEFLNLAQETVYGVKATSADQKYVTEYTQNLEGTIKEALDKTGGDYSRLNDFADALGNKIKKDIMTSKLGAIHNNFIKAQTATEELNKLRQAGQIREASYNRALESINSFKGTQETEDGGFTTISPYTPPKYIEFGETADNYGRFVADQYRANGMKYIDKNVASEHIYNNLMNNDEVRANVEDEIWNTYGELPPDEKRIAVEAYTRKLAQAAGFKIAYEQRQELKVDGRSGDSLDGRDVILYDIHGGKPSSVVFGEETGGMLAQAREARNVGVFGKFLANMVSGSMAARSPMVNRDEISQSIEDSFNPEIQRTITNIVTSDIVKDKVEELNRTREEGDKIDLSDATLDDVKNLMSLIDEENASSANTRLVLRRPSGTKELNDRNARFESDMTSGAYMYMPMYDASTGRELDPKERVELITNYKNLPKADRETGEGGIVLAGELAEPGQAYAQNSLVLAINDKDGIRHVVVDVNNRKNSPEYISDRIQAAFNFGQASFRLHNQLHQFVRVGDNVRHYIEGKRVTRKTEDGEEFPVEYNFK